MSGVLRKMRCAIYTRKSTEEGLDMDYNSLDAQRDACPGVSQGVCIGSMNKIQPCAVPVFIGFKTVSARCIDMNWYTLCKQRQKENLKQSRTKTHPTTAQVKNHSSSGSVHWNVLSSLLLRYIAPYFRIITLTDLFPSGVAGYHSTINRGYYQKYLFISNNYFVKKLSSP